MKDPNQLEFINPNTGRLKVQTQNLDKSMAQQQYKEECDINNIMKKYESTGEFRVLTGRTGTYQDFSEITDYQTMLETIKYAQDAFASLPAKTRQRFSNDPAEILTFLQNPANLAEAISIGLIDPPVETPVPPKPTP